VSEYQQLYRMYDKDGRLLYVGISKSALSRYAQHAIDKEWIRHVTRMEIETCRCTRDDIEAKERRAIREERPLYNIAGKTQDRWEPYRRTVWPSVRELVAEYWQSARFHYRVGTLYPRGKLRPYLWSVIKAHRELLRVVQYRTTDLLTLADMQLIEWRLSQQNQIPHSEVLVMMGHAIDLLTRYGRDEMPEKVAEELRKFAPMPHSKYGLRAFSSEQQTRITAEQAFARSIAARHA